jgi:ABC-type uncharacterized transport system ATPase subunit
MIHEGRKVLDASLDEIRSQYDPRTIEFDPIDPSPDLSQLRTIEGVEEIRRTGNGHEVRLEHGTDPSVAMRHLIEQLPVSRIELARPRLEDVFVQIVSGSSDRRATERLRAEMREEATA